ncbi:SapC family protein [Oceaniradius stylonematis]|uniref:SapC family protein n=1 Tax=Oceaniradius stylonematis TaxID=2184161 RepID=UPI003C7B6738
MTETKTEEKPAAGKDANGAESGGLPAMYETVAVLSAGLHGDLRFTPANRFNGASQMNAIIVAAAEFPEAALHYPLVFSEQDGRRAAHVITGHSAGENRFVEKSGKWRSGSYIPAYVRRYPFILVEDKAQDRLTLAADLKSRWFDSKKGDRLFEDGKPSEAAQNAMSFCQTYHNQLLETDKLLAAIAGTGLLVDRNADVTLPDETKRRITGFQVVDEEKLAQLDDETFLSLRKNGALALIYCHLISMRNWRNIVGGSK